MKGFFKGFKYTLTHIFVVKEREMEIGNPTDVKHLAHVGCNEPSGNAAPSWMKEFKTGPNFEATSIARSASSLSPWSSSSQDIGGSIRHHLEAEASETQLNKPRHNKSIRFSPPRRVLHLR